MPGGEGVKQKSETVQALERELTRHGLDLADVVDLFSHDAASEDEDEPVEQREKQLPTPEFQVAQGVVNCAHGHPLGYVYTRDGSRRLVYEARVDEASASLWVERIGKRRLHAESELQRGLLPPVDNLGHATIKRGLRLEEWRLECVVLILLTDPLERDALAAAVAA